MDHICRVRISTCSNVCRIASVHVAFCFYMHSTLHLLVSRKWDHASCTRTCKHTGDRLLDTKANWIFMNMKGTIFQPRVLQLNWDNKNRPHTANTPSEKIGECGTRTHNLLRARQMPKPLGHRLLWIYCSVTDVLMDKIGWSWGTLQTPQVCLSLIVTLWVGKLFLS